MVLGFSRALAAVLMGLAFYMAAMPQPAQAGLFHSKEVRSEEYKLSFGGRTRTYRLYVPASYHAGNPVPLVVALHPGYSTDTGMEKITKFDDYADKYGFIVAYPNGISLAWNAGTCCAIPMKQHVDDAGFVRAVVEAVAARYTIDRSRMLATGFSNGAFLTHYIACKEPQMFTSYATVEGTLMTSPQECVQGTPTRFLILHGTDDPRVTYNGGEFEGTYRMSVADQVAMLAQRNHCKASDQTVIYNQSPAVCRSVNGCAAEVSYCALSGVGHQWAGGKAALKFLLGNNTDAFSDSQAIVDFFLKRR